MEFLTNVFCLSVMLYSEGSLLEPIDRLAMAQVAIARMQDDGHGELCLTLMENGQFHMDFEGFKTDTTHVFEIEAQRILTMNIPSIIHGGRFFTHNDRPPGNSKDFDKCVLWNETRIWALKGECE